MGKKYKVPMLNNVQSLNFKFGKVKLIVELTVYFYNWKILVKWKDTYIILLVSTLTGALAVTLHTIYRLFTFQE